MFFFFSLAHLIHYTDMKLYILQYKRKMERERKHSSCTKSWERERGLGHLFFLSFCLLSGGRGWGDERKQNGLQRARVQRDAELQSANSEMSSDRQL